MNKIIENIERQHRDDIENIKQNIKVLQSHDESKLIINKLLTMHPQSIYNIFYTIFTGFGTDYAALNTLSILIQGMLDDIAIYAETKETEISKSIQKRNKGTILEGKIKPFYEIVFNTSEKGEYQNQESLLKIIDDYEKKEIKKIISIFNNMKNRKDEMKVAKEYLITFSQENQESLPDEIKEYMKNI